MAEFHGPLTRVLSVQDYGPGMIRRKQWEVALTMHALEQLGALHPGAVALGIGAGRERTIFELTRRVGRVIATDLYAGAGQWSADAPAAMLTNPARFVPAGLEADLSRLRVKHMDARKLDLPDSSVDLVFSCSSIEHFGTWEDIEQAGREIGRVLKPGGVASICTEFKITGDGDGWPGVKLFDRKALRSFIDATGLSLVDNTGLKLTIDAATKATEWPLRDIVLRRQWPAIEGVLVEYGYRFTSVHLALRKPGQTAGPVDASVKTPAIEETGSDVDLAPFTEGGYVPAIDAENTIVISAHRHVEIITPAIEQEIEQESLEQALEQAAKDAR